MQDKFNEVMVQGYGSRLDLRHFTTDGNLNPHNLLITSVSLILLLFFH